MLTPFFCNKLLLSRYLPAIEAGKIGLAVPIPTASAVIVTAAPPAPTKRPGITPVSISRVGATIGIILLVPQMWRYVAVARAATLQVQTSKLSGKERREKKHTHYYITVQQIRMDGFCAIDSVTVWSERPPLSQLYCPPAASG